MLTYLPTYPPTCENSYLVLILLLHTQPTHNHLSYGKQRQIHSSIHPSIHPSIHHLSALMLVDFSSSMRYSVHTWNNNSFPANRVDDLTTILPFTVL